MSYASSDVRHVVAWLQPVRAITSIALWAVLAVVWAFPHLDLSLRGIRLLGLPAAICRTLVAVTDGRRRNVAPRFLGLSFVSDAVLLTPLLDVTGGPFNPFIVMYAGYVWAAAVVASRVWAAAVLLVSLAGFGWLVVDHLPAGLIEHHRLNDFPTHLFTMWFAGAGVAELVAHYVARARAAFARQQAHVDEARERAMRSERLASLTAMAAGAAHELSTPLATIAVAAREVERNAERVVDPQAVGSALRDDARLIRSELDRCEAILDGMSGRAGAGVSTALEPLAPAAIARLVQERLPDERRQRLDIEIAPAARTASATGAEMVQAISSLLTNAFDASGSEDRVTLRFTARDGMARIEVRDRGPGMAADTLRRVGEPFFTTKEPGRGLGLGLFLARTFAERSGGTLEFDVTGGTTAILEIPARSEDATRAG
ncbi:MAG: ATP-binding protein [Acidobacteriota bacterium]